MTWGDPKEGTGWACVFLEEVDDLKRTFNEEYDGDEAKFFEYWPQGFRWTCCGMTGDMSYGCDHHGRGKKPCTCDFCKMGKPLPDRIYFEQCASRKGLDLARGPDPRSSNFILGTIAEIGRAITGLDND
ncbi:hypothetical protein HGRIS_005579 [Hohenbuehelia grisea]|uniref:Uncharacterized protein n=1 Tax=Hohenbuehelia grisea TaxID=104357 RepID=A0ABR3JXG5_9AGAR